MLYKINVCGLTFIGKLFKLMNDKLILQMNCLAKYAQKLGFDTRVLLTANARYLIHLKTGFLQQWQPAQPKKFVDLVLDLLGQCSIEAKRLMFAALPIKANKKKNKEKQTNKQTKL